jgi:AcrR family transcriptional regulator
MPKIIENVRERIIEVAYNLFIQEGYEQVKTAKIARDCEIAAGTLFNYFPTKWELLREILEKVRDHGLDELNRAVDDKTDIYEQLLFMVSGMFYIIDRIGRLGKEFFIYILSLDKTDLGRWKHEDPLADHLMLTKLGENFPQIREFSEDELHLLIRSFHSLVITAYTQDKVKQEARKHFVCRSFLAMLDSNKYKKEC